MYRDWNLSVLSYKSLIINISFLKPAAAHLSKRCLEDYNKRVTRSGYKIKLFFLLKTKKFHSSTGI